VRKHLWFHLARGDHRSQSKHRNPKDFTTTFTEGIWDGDAWKDWQRTRKEALDDDPTSTWFNRVGVYELFFILFCDGYQPFEKTSYTTTALLLAIGNLPLRLQRRRENLICVALIPGTIQHYFNLMWFRVRFSHIFTVCL
jgi:hypothetical protein